MFNYVSLAIHPRNTEAAFGGVLYKKVFLKIVQNSQENTCVRDSFLMKRLAQVFSSEFSEIFKNTFFTEHIQATTSKNVCFFVS